MTSVIVKLKVSHLHAPCRYDYRFGWPREYIPHPRLADILEANNYWHRIRSVRVVDSNDRSSSYGRASFLTIVLTDL